jgi:hypothetical protein
MFASFRAVLVSCACYLASTTGAWPQAVVRPENILTEAKVEYFCTKSTPRLVDKFTFASAIVSELKVPFDLMIRANPDGNPSGAVGRGEILHYATSDAPFGDNVPAADQARVRAAVDDRLNFMNYFGFYLAHGGSGSYKVVRSGGTLSAPGDYFKPGSSVDIECHSKQQSQGTGPGGSAMIPTAAATNAATATNKWLENVVVRKSVAELVIPQDKVTKADGALFSYTDNQATHRTTFAVEGLIGYKIVGSSADRAEKLAVARDSQVGAQLPDAPSYWFNITPYVYDKKSTTTPNSKTTPDIDVVQPGVTGNLTWVSGGGLFAFDLQADVNHISDQAQRSELTTAAVRLSPSFLLGNIILFKAPIDFVFFKIRPDVSVIAREYLIEDVGVNPMLKGKSSFSTVGGDSTAKVTFPTTLAILSNLELRFEYKYLMNSDNVPDVRYWTTGLSYAFPGIQNVTLDIDYTDGRDERTLQDERILKAGLAVRY